MILAQFVCAAIVGVGSTFPRQQDGVSVNGRVVDGGGTPVAAAEIQVWQKGRSPDNTEIRNERVAFDSLGPLRTDAGGRFKTPAVLSSENRIRVIATADGMVAGRGPWVKPTDKKLIELDDILLQRLRTVSGQVVDRHGQPVADATVFHAGDAHDSPRTKTDDRGLFRVPGVPEGRLFLFAEKSGYRFTGKLVDAAAASTKLVLARSDEVAEPLVTRPPELSPDAARALARHVLEPFLEAATKSGTNDDKYWAAFTLSEIDRLEAFERLDSMNFSAKRPDRDEPTERDNVAGYIVMKLAVEKPVELRDEICAMIESIEDPDWAAGGYTSLAKFTPSSERARKLEFIQQAILRTQTQKSPASRARGLAVLARLLNELGATERAGGLIQEAKRQADALTGQQLEDWGAFAALAAVLAPTDLPTALGWLDRIANDRMFAVRSGEVAVQLVKNHAAAAERIWLHVAERKSDDKYMLTARDVYKSATMCYRLARSDRERARRIIDSVHDPSSKVHSLEAMAQALAGSDPPAARALLLESMSAIGYERTKTHGDQDVTANLASTAAGLLPITERLDPGLARELFWRAISLRPPRPTTEWLDDEVEYADLELAKMLSRYDPLIARHLIDGVRLRLQWPKYITNRPQVYNMVWAAAATDPNWAIELLNQLPDPTDANSNAPKHDARGWIARVLADQANGRWEMAGHWSVGTND